jgi:hypothetical protein
MKQITVKHLIAILKQCNPESIIVLSRDSEGNEFHPMVEEIAFGKYAPHNPERPYMGGELEDSSEKDSNAVCLWPSN